jgi:ribonuclease HI
MIEIYSDGGSRGNPGEAAIGVIILDDSGIIKMHKEKIGKATNNAAEYKAAIKGLELAKNYKEVIFYLDSELVCRQLKGEYKVKDKKLAKLFNEAKKLEKKIGVIWKNVPRENKFMQEADKLVNEALDSQ